MRVMVMIKATEESEAGRLPSEELLTAMGSFNEELVDAGVMLGGDGLQPSSKGVRVGFSGAERTTTDGPFAQPGDLVAGYWLWQVDSIEEAVDWARRIPNPTGDEGQVEIRPLFESEDFGDNLTPELREQETRLRERLESAG